jgi:asparagine synthetase B (glutamine-hydrolysing)
MAALGSRLFPATEGMFALVLHDRESGEVHVARDGFGIKPL